jgi:hypothetical protein
MIFQVTVHLYIGLYLTLKKGCILRWNKYLLFYRTIRAMTFENTKICKTTWFRRQIK